MKYNGTMYYYLLNIQGDVIGLFNESGTRVVTYSYDAWGNTSITCTSTYTALSHFNPFRYRGYVYDEETGLYYLQSRYYNPLTGRFISADSYLVSGNHINGTNMFAYCLNNPVMYVDPRGTDTSDEIGFAFQTILYAAFYAGSLLYLYGEKDAFAVAQEFVDSGLGFSEVFVDVTDKLNEELIINALYLSQIIADLGTVAAIQFFVDNVKTGGIMDFKNNPDWNLKKYIIYIFEDNILRYDDLANINYGFIGRLLFSEEMLLIAGGVVQIWEKTSKIDYIFPNFDDPHDQWAISFGYHLWDR